MKTNREVIYNFRQFVTREGFTSDDLTFTDKAILYYLFNSRSVILKQRKKQGEKISQLSYQTIPCVELEVVDRADCPTTPRSGCTWKKSTCPIPTPIFISSVSTILGLTKATYVPWDRVSAKLNSRIKENREEAYYTIKNVDGDSYLYLYNKPKHKIEKETTVGVDLGIKDFLITSDGEVLDNPKYLEDLEVITMTGIWENPIEAATYCGANEDIKCNPLDASFFTEAYFIDPIVKSTAQTIFNYRSVSTTDIENDDTGLK